MYKFFIKILLDILISILALPFVLLIVLIVSITIKLDDGGPIFYNSIRLGKNGKSFKMYKFRSMKVNAPDLRQEDGSTFNSDNDIRITKVGKVLRKTSIDEIPQIINVLKGEMSIVGPRPDLPDGLEIYDDYEIRKLDVKPGITGYSQAFFRNSVEMKYKFKNDVYYVDNVSFILDCKIILKTIKSVIFKENIYVK